MSRIEYLERNGLDVSIEYLGGKCGIILIRKGSEVVNKSQMIDFTNREIKQYALEMAQ